MEEAEERVQQIQREIARVVVGQSALIEGLLIALFSGGHALVEGVPGLAKTTAVRTLAEVLGLGFGRIQLLLGRHPSHLNGTIPIPVHQNGQLHQMKHLTIPPELGIRQELEGLNFLGRGSRESQDLLHKLLGALALLQADGSSKTVNSDCI